MTAMRVCARHERAYPAHETCIYCEPVPLADTLRRVDSSRDAYHSRKARLIAELRNVVWVPDAMDDAGDDDDCVFDAMLNGRLP